MTTSEDRLESDEPTSPAMNPDAWPTIETSPENTTRRSRRPGAWSSQEPGTGSPESGARRLESRARSRETGTRSPELGARNLEPGTRTTEPEAGNPVVSETVVTAEENGSSELWLLDPDRTSVMRSDDGVG